MKKEIQNTQRFRKVRKWGNSLVVVLTKTDVTDIGIKEGDYFDISDCIIVSRELYKLKTEAKK